MMDALIPKTFKQSLGSRRMSFKRTNYAYESLSQVWFLRGYSAFGLMCRSSVVLHDGWWRCPFKGQLSKKEIQDHSYCENDHICCF
jgi:hypothetical protein